MSFVISRPEVLAMAAQNPAAAAAAKGLLPAAADEISVLSATGFDAKANAVYETEAVNTVAARQGG